MNTDGCCTLAYEIDNKFIQHKNIPDALHKNFDLEKAGKTISAITLYWLVQLGHLSTTRDDALERVKDLCNFDCVS